jgi:hypothetical protein
MSKMWKKHLSIVNPMCIITHWYLKRISTYLTSNVHEDIEKFSKTNPWFTIQNEHVHSCTKSKSNPQEVETYAVFSIKWKETKFQNISTPTYLELVWRFMYVINFHWSICGSKRQWIFCTNFMLKRLIITTKLSSPCIKFCATYFIFIFKFIIIYFLYGMFCSWEYGSEN